MAQRNLTVRYSTEGFAGAINSLKQVGQAFDSALAASMQAAAQAAEAARNAQNPEEIERANKEVERSVTQANQIISNSYRALGVRQETDVKRQKESAIAAFNAIKNSGVASASDIARAQVALNRRLEELDRSLETVEEQARETGGGFTVLKGAIAGVISGAVLSGFGQVTNFIGNLARSVFSAGTTTENLKAQLKTLTGSAEGAATAYAKIAEFAKTTPYELEEVTQAYISLANRGVKPTNELLTQLGDIAASQGKPLQQAVEAILDATTGENERLKEFGINASKSGDKVTFTFKGVSKTVNATAEEISKAILSFGELDGVLGGMNERAKTTEGQLSNLTDSLKAVYVQIFDAIKPALDAVISAATSIIAPLAEQEGLFADINVQAQDFKKFLADNPQIVAAIGDQLKNVVLVVMERLAASAKSVLSYLEQNPDAISKTVDNLGFLVSVMGEFLKLIGMAIDGWRQIFELIELAAGRASQQNNLNFAQANNVTQEEIRQRFIQQYGIDPFIPGTGLAVRVSTFGRTNLQDAIARVVQDLVIEKQQNFIGPPAPPPLPVSTPPKTNSSLPSSVLPPSTPSAPSVPPKTSPPTSSAPSAPASSKKELTAQQEFAAKTISIAKELKIDPMALMTIMLFESAGTLSPKVQGPLTSQGRGRGLIQFMPATAKGLGTSDAALAGMTQLQQLDWVKKYFAQFKGNFGAGKLENLYAAVLAGDPQAVNATDGYTTASKGAERMVKEWGNKAASLLADVPQGEDFSTQYEFNQNQEEEQRNREEELRRQQEEQRRQEEERRQNARERREQQQALDSRALSETAILELQEFDLESASLPETASEVREILRKEKEKKLELTEKLSEIDQQISNLEIEREEKLVDKAAGLPVTPRDITAEIQSLERQKQLEIRVFEFEKAIGRDEFAERTKSQDEVRTARQLAREVGSYYLDEESSALSALEDKYQGYRQSIDDTISSLETLINNKKLSGQSTKTEEAAIASLREQKTLIPQYKKAESNDLKRDFRLGREGEKIDIDGQLIDTEAQISERKAEFLASIGFTFAANRIRKKSAIATENNRYQSELNKAEKELAGEPDKLAEFKAKAEELNLVNLESINQQFKTLGLTVEDLGISAIQGFFTQISTNFFDGKAEQERALLEERLRYAEELVQLENQYKEEPGHLAHLKNRARELNEQKLDKIKSEFNGFKRVVNIAGQALLEFTKQLAAMAAQYAAAKFISSIFGSALGGIGGGGAASVGNDFGAGVGTAAFTASKGITVGSYAQGGSIKSRIVPASISQYLSRNNPNIAKAFRAEGEGAQLGVFHTGEELLSRKTGEAGVYQALKRRLGFNPLQQLVSNYAQGGTVDVNSNILSGISSVRPRIDLSGLSEVRSQRSEVRKTVNVHTTVVTPNADSFRLNQDQMNQDLVERMRRGI